MTDTLFVGQRLFCHHAPGKIMVHVIARITPRYAFVHYQGVDYRLDRAVLESRGRFVGPDGKDWLTQYGADLIIESMPEGDGEDDAP